MISEYDPVVICEESMIRKEETKARVGEEEKERKVCL